jgi:ferredoxin
VQINVDKDKCIASGMCVLVAPNVFSQDEDGIVVPLVRRPDPDLEAEVSAAIRACPAAVIWSES